MQKKNKVRQCTNNHKKGQEKFEEVEEFTYLGAVITIDVSCQKDMILGRQSYRLPESQKHVVVLHRLKKLTLNESDLNLYPTSNEAFSGRTR